MTARDWQTRAARAGIGMGDWRLVAGWRDKWTCRTTVLTKGPGAVDGTKHKGPVSFQF